MTAAEWMMPVSGAISARMVARTLASEAESAISAANARTSAAHLFQLRDACGSFFRHRTAPADQSYRGSALFYQPLAPMPSRSRPSPPVTR